MTTKIAGTPGLEIDVVGGYPRIRGDFSNSSVVQRFGFQSSVVNGGTTVLAIPNGTSSVSQFVAVNASDPTNSGNATLVVTSSEASLRAGAYGSGQLNPITFYTNNQERMRLAVNGNLGIGATNPAYFIDVDKSTGTWEFVRLKNSQAAAAALIRCESGSGGNIDFGAAGNTASEFVVRTAGLERARITASGDLLIGKTATDWSAPGFQTEGFGTSLVLTRSGSTSLTLRRNTSDGGVAQFARDGSFVGSISVTATSTAYNTSSDYRLKENITDLIGSGEFIDSLRPRKWNWKLNANVGVGFIAHELQEVSPTSVSGIKDEITESGEPVYQAVEYGSAEVIANMVAELQALRRRVAELEARANG